MNKRELIFVTGYFGAPIREEAHRIAACKGWSVLDLDRAIEEKDGRSIARLCMMGGEHAYRNAEYEMVEALCESGRTEGGRTEGGRTESSRTEEEALVVACGDGILYDDDSRSLILKHELVIAGEDLSVEQLWTCARQDEDTYHAFMKFGSEEEKRVKFEEHHRRQAVLFGKIRENDDRK